MTDPPDLQTLAGRYLDLWQEQLGAMARDPAVSDALARSFSLMTQGLAEAAQGARPADDPAAGGEHARTRPPPEANPDGATREPGVGSASDSGTGTGHTAGPAAAGPASGDSGPADDELAARIERLEQRVALLEAALGGVLAGAGRSPGA